MNNLTITLYRVQIPKNANILQTKLIQISFHNFRIESKRERFFLELIFKNFQQYLSIMGNYCCSQSSEKTPKFDRKVSRLSNSTNASQFNGLDSMKKQSQKILKFLNDQNPESICLTSSPIKDIEVVAELGKGGQSQVFEVIVKTEQNHHKQNTAAFEERLALKRINLRKQKHNIESIALSEKLLKENNCPFLIKSLFSIETQKYFYEAMKVMEGGELTQFLEKWRGKGDAFRKLGEEGTKMVLAGVLLGLQELYRHDLTYRDLKTQNVLIGMDGYPVLIDFQLSTSQKKIPTQGYQGTLTSMAPQIFTKQFVDRSVDLWALGVLVYTIVYGQTPFSADQALASDYAAECQRREGKYYSVKKNVSKQLTDLINSLLRVEPKSRLGYRCLQQIKTHRFFHSFDWEKYYNKQIQNPLALIAARFPTKNTLRKKNSLPEYMLSSEFADLSKNKLNCKKSVQ